MRGALLWILVLAAAGLIGALLYAIEIPTDLADYASLGESRADTSFLARLEGFRFPCQDPVTGMIEWEARGARAASGGPAQIRIEQPTLVLYGQPDITEPTPSPPLRAEAELATASILPESEAVIRFESRIRIVQGSSSMTGEEIVVMIPPRSKLGPRAPAQARIFSPKPVVLQIAEPQARIEGSGLQADVAQRSARLEPPVSMSAEAGALIRSERESPRRVNGESLFLDTAQPVDVQEVGEDGYRVRFAGPTRGRYERAGEARPYLALAREGGVLYLRKPQSGGLRALPPASPEPPAPPLAPITPPERSSPAGLAPAPESRAGAAGSEQVARNLRSLLLEAASARFEGGIEARAGKSPLANAERLLFDGETDVLTLEAGPPPDGRAALFHPEGSIQVRAETIRYLRRTAEAELLGRAELRLDYAPSAHEISKGGERLRELSGTWHVEAPRAVVRFGPPDGGEASRLRSVHAAGTVKIRHEPGGAHAEAAIARFRADDERLELEGDAGSRVHLARRPSDVLARSVTLRRASGLLELQDDVEAELAPDLFFGLEPPAAPPGRGRPARDGGERESDLLTRSIWHVEADRVTVRFDPVSGTLAALEVAGDERQALVRSRPVVGIRPRPIEVRGARIRATGDLSIEVVGESGEVSRQWFSCGRDCLEAREIRYDARSRLAIARGEVLYRRVEERGGAELRAEGDELRVRFAPDRTAAAAVPGGRQPEAGAATATADRRPLGGLEYHASPESIEFGGPGGVELTFSPESLGASEEEAALRSDRFSRPLRLRASRILALFDPPDGAGSGSTGEAQRSALRSLSAEGDGGEVTIEPAFDAPPDERFRLVGGRLALDAPAGLLRLEGTASSPPVLTRGREETLEAPVVTLDTRTLVVSLDAGVRGRFHAPPPDSLEGRTGSQTTSLFEFEAERARVSLGRERASRLRDRVESVLAEGKVRFRDEETEVLADSAEYRRLERTVTLRGSPLVLTRGKHKSSPRELVIRLAPREGEKE